MAESGNSSGEPNSRTEPRSESSSLVKIAQQAGFSNLHDLAGVSTCFIGSIASDVYETIYFRKNEDIKTGPKNPETGGFPVTDMGTVEVFGIVDPYDYDSCALYRLDARELLDANQRKVSEPLNSVVTLEHKTALYKGRQAVEVLKTFKPHK